ncbi:MAG TPA: hypothetical protein VK698_30850 [Kofleriaceae bacterium]|nr:hypothetical protein [Kofleriaceae bacterium]
MMVERGTSPTCLSDLRLDLLVAGELDPGAASAARAHLAACADCTARLAVLEGEREQIRAHLPPFPGRAAPPAARPRGSRPRARRWAWPLAAAAAAALVLVVWPRRTIDETGDDGAITDTTRRKGGPTLALFVRRGDRVTAGASGEVVHPGDEIQFAATSSDPAFLVIASVDAAGRVSVYHPTDRRAAPIGPGSDRLVPGGVLLDDVLGTELVYGFFCRDRIEVSAARAAIEAGTPSALPSLPGCQVDQLALIKRPR